MGHGRANVCASFGDLARHPALEVLRFHTSPPRAPLRRAAFGANVPRGAVAPAQILAGGGPAARLSAAWGCRPPTTLCCSIRVPEKGRAISSSAGRCSPKSGQLRLSSPDFDRIWAEFGHGRHAARAQLACERHDSLARHRQRPCRDAAIKGQYNDIPADIFHLGDHLDYMGVRTCSAGCSPARGRRHEEGAATVVV